MPGLIPAGTAAERAPVRRLLGQVAFWQALAFVLLLCAVWGLHFATTGAGADARAHRLHAAYLSGCIVLVGFISVAHTYLQQQHVLAGLVVSCAYCHRIRLEGSHWEPLERYLSRRSLARFSHGICPDCLARRHPGVPAAAEPAPSRAAG